MNTQTDSRKKVTAKSFAAHEDFTLVEPLPTRRATFSKEETPAAGDAERRENNLHRAIIVGAVLILILVAVVYYFRFVAAGDSADYLPPL
jgi:hypothetical protein